MILLLLLLAGPLQASERFVLTSLHETAAILIPDREPAYLRIAANDLIMDVRRITGRTLAVVRVPDACRPGCVVLASASDSAEILRRLAPELLNELAGKSEYFHIRNSGPMLFIAGSDPRGVMWGVYDFLERDLGVDPMYLWTGFTPKKRAELAWGSIDRASGEASFRFRGWFVNDEDLLSEWKPGGGPRNIDYPYYSQVTAPEVLDRVLETMVRLKFNLVIPASFTDLENPAERRMIEAAARRGLYVSMHHVEPMGVSAFAFGNYWRARGKTVEYSYSKNPDAFHEVWRHYATLWAQFPDVVWQVGLRGVADRPVWFADKSAPADDAGRGAMISKAIIEQIRIIRDLDKRKDPPITTTLWMEGSYLFGGGHLRVPEPVTIVFADNNAGWQWQRDFYDVRRQSGRRYGVYYHHAVWGQGPHMVQAVPPWKTHQMLREAGKRNGPASYVILNVANVREFALGLAASSRMTWSVDDFDEAAFLREWTTERFGDQAEAVRAAYRRFFESYVISEKRGTPDLLDGLALHEGERLLQALLAKMAIERPKPREEVFARGFSDTRPVGEEEPGELKKRIQKQLDPLDEAIRAASALKLDGEAKAFLDANLIGQAMMLRGICRWTSALASTVLARDSGDLREARRQVQAALAAIAEIRTGQAMNTRGEWSEWYRGDRKMNLNRAEEGTRKLKEIF